MNQEGSVERLIQALVAFRQERDWEQFHTPKNLAVSITIEASELLELFQWLKDEHALSPEAKAEAAREIGDVLIYLLLLSHDLGIDPFSAAAAKLEENAEKYPVEKAKGNARKYNDL
jgi:dCTP diphosphatase